jgi:DNA polymerase-3 subunit delta
MPPPKTLHAIDYLASPEDYPPRPVCVAFGDEAFLKRQVLTRLRQAVLGGGEGDYSLSTFEGPDAALHEVLEELATLAMFGQGKRLVVVEDADHENNSFVSRYRGELEDYVARPKSTGVLVLEVTSWPANTRLYKAVAASGLPIECTAPPAARLTRWLASWAKQAHGASLEPVAAEALLEMVGPELGLLDQELAKLAVTAERGQKVSAAMVSRVVGSWRAKTVWEMLDAVLDGNVAQALGQLDRLLLAGENPIAILGQVSASLRRLAAATRLVLDAEAVRRRVPLRDALQQAGVKSFVVEKVERQLRRLGRQRGDQLYRWLLEADLDLKGDSTLAPRTILERLFLRLATPK